MDIKIQVETVNYREYTVLYYQGPAIKIGALRFLIENNKILELGNSYFVKTIRILHNENITFAMEEMEKSIKAYYPEIIQQFITFEYDKNVTDAGK